MARAKQPTGHVGEIAGAPTGPAGETAGPPGASGRILREVSSWPGVDATKGPRGALSFTVRAAGAVPPDAPARREIGHLHGDRAAHFAFPKDLWSELMEQGRVEPHPLGRPGLAARRIAGDDDVDEVVALMRLNYDRRVEGHGAPSGGPLAGLRVAVTGGTSGLGLALVEALRDRGARVAFVARTTGRVDEVARSLPGTHGIAGDVSSKDDTHRIALRITAALGGLDVLIHNASSLGPVPLALLADTECEELEEALATNLVGPFRLTKALLGALAVAAREGRRPLVVHVSSDAATTPYAGWGAYGASKAALLHLSRIWGEELREHGIGVHAVDPGDMDTPLHALAVPGADPSTLRRPADAAREIADLVEAARNPRAPSPGGRKAEARASV